MLPGKQESYCGSWIRHSPVRLWYPEVFLLWGVDLDGNFKGPTESEIVRHRRPCLLSARELSVSFPGPTIGKRNIPDPSVVCRHLAIELDELITNLAVLVLATEDKDSSDSIEAVPIHANILDLELDVLGTRTAATVIEDSLQGLKSPPGFVSAVLVAKEIVSHVVEHMLTTVAEGD